MRWVALITLVILIIAFFSPVLMNWGGVMKDRFRDAWDDNSLGQRNAKAEDEESD